MEDYRKLISEMERERKINNLSKSESQKKVMSLQNDLFKVEAEIKKMEKYFGSEKFEGIKDNEFEKGINFFNNDYEEVIENYLSLYDKKLSEESKLIKEIQFYIEKC